MTSLSLARQRGLPDYYRKGIVWPDDPPALAKYHLLLQSNGVHFVSGAKKASVMSWGSAGRQYAVRATQHINKLINHYALYARLASLCLERGISAMADTDLIKCLYSETGLSCGPECRWAC
jgi:hypothetical protein